MPDDIKTEDDKPASPFLADGDKKQGDTAEKREEHPDPSQPATQEADDAPVSVGQRTNPVVTEGTTEVPNQPDPGYQFADPNDPIRQRYVEMERQKDEQIAELVKQGDGKPKV